MSNNQFADIAEVAATNTDLTKDQSFTRKVARAGVALLRLREYVELGIHDAKKAGNKPSLQCRFTFELLHPAHMLEDKDGKKYPDVLRLTLPYGITGASMYRKLFKKMNYTGTKTHFSQMLGDPFVGKLTHNKVGDTTYVNLSDDQAWNIGAPRVENLMEGTVTEVPVPELHNPVKLFLWENPGMTEEFIRKMWDSIYNGETYTKNDEEMSMNWDQEAIRASNTWEGSATQSAVDANMDAVTTKVENTKSKVDLVEPVEKDDAQEEDPLAALGL